MEKTFLENGLVAFWMARLTLLFRDRLQSKLNDRFLGHDYPSGHWLRIFLPYLEQRGKTCLQRVGQEEDIIVNTSAFFKELKDLIPELEAKKCSFDPILKKNLDLFSEALNLDDKERTLLTFIVLSKSDPFFEDFLEDLEAFSFNSLLQGLSNLFGWSLEDFHQVLTS